MKRAILAALVALVALGAVLGVVTTRSAHAAASPCFATAKEPVITNGGSGFLAARYAVNCTDDQTWTVDATVQALINGTWQRALNTDVSTLTFHGDATVTAPVENGQWNCTPGRAYRTHSVYRNGSGGQADNSTSVGFGTAC